jgi:hypothetical protein
VDGLGLQAGGLVHALGGAAGGRTQQQLHVFRRENAQNGVDNNGLANARAAGDDEHLGTNGHGHCGFPAFCKGQADALLDPGDRLAGIDPRPGKLALEMARSAR